MKVLCSVLLIYIIQITVAQQIKIGGLFGKDENILEKAFRYAVEDINENKNTLVTPLIAAKTEIVAKADSFAVSQAVCNLIKEGVIGVFGPASTVSSPYVQSMCNAKGLPHIEIHMNSNHEQGINFFPHAETLSKVFVDLVEERRWKSFTILYENTDSLPRLSELLKLNGDKGTTISLKQLYSKSDNYRSIFQELKISRETHFLLDCSTDKLFNILKQAMQVGLMSDHYSYIITTPDLHTLDLEHFMHSGANIIGIRLIDPEDQDVKEMVEVWNSKEVEKGNTSEEKITPEHLSTNTALMFDAVKMFATSLKNLNLIKLNKNNIDCNNSTTWDYGVIMVNNILTKNMKGLTREIKFDGDGFRTDFLLDIVRLSETGIKKIGTWDSKFGLNIKYEFPAESLVNQSLIVSINLSPPFVMLKESSLAMDGNDRFEGFCIELIQEISKMLGFSYTFQLQEDNVYGSWNSQTNEWNGMIGNLIQGGADLAITDMTITSDRMNAVDFTEPFMQLGIGLLYKKPSTVKPDLFIFMSPFSNQVWMYLGAAYLGISQLLFMIGRIAPKERNNSNPSIEKQNRLKTQFNVANSFWFAVGGATQQSSDVAPKAISTRIVAGVWWFFILIMVSSYTANLAALLTIKTTELTINSAEDLIDNPHGITYGALRHGSTARFFQNTKYPPYQNIYKYMLSNPDAMSTNSNEGVKRVKNGNYAYFMESSSIEYFVERDCELRQVGGLLNNRAFGIAMKKNSPYRTSLSTAILKLQEEGKLAEMKIKWWKGKTGHGVCEIRDEISAKLDLSYFNGVFMVLMAGCTLGSIVACGEMIYKVSKNSTKHKSPFYQELRNELRFIISWKGDTKTVRHRSRSNSASPEGSFSAKGESKNTIELNIQDSNIDNGK